MNKFLKNIELSLWGARGSVVGWGTMLQARRSQVRYLISLDFLIGLNLPAALWLWVNLASNRNDYQDLPGGKVQPVRKAGNLTKICCADHLENVGALMSHNPMGLHGLLQRHLHLLFIIIRISKQSIGTWTNLVGHCTRKKG
jgi:hypothetical protein